MNGKVNINSFGALIIFCLILVLVLIYGIWEDRINRAVRGWMR